MNIFTKTKNTIMSSKVTKSDTLVESIDDIGKGVVSGDIILLPEEYSNFWSQIAQDRQSCARYMARIVVTLLNFEQDMVKTERSFANKSAIVSPDHIINLLLNTIQFIDMFIGFDPKNEAFVSAMEKFELAKKTNPSFKNKNIHDGLLGLSKRRAHRGLAAVKMIVECSSLESPEEIFHGSGLNASAAGGSPQRPSSSSISSSFADDMEDSALEKATVDFPFTFTGLSRMTKSDISPMIFDELLKQLEGAGSALSSMAHMQGRTLALMFMLREFLTISPTADHMWMQRACLVLIGLYKWPKPYGIVAKELLDFIYLERRAPGCHLRERIMQENPSMHPVVMLKHLQLSYTPLHPKEKDTDNDTDKEKEKKDNCAFSADQLLPYFAPPSRTCPVNFVFLDKSVPLCCTHKVLLLQSKTSTTSPNSTESGSRSGSFFSVGTSGSRVRTSSSEEQSVLNEMRIEVISNIFDTDFVVFPPAVAKSKNKIKDPLGLVSLSEEDLVILYCRVLEVLERAKSLPVNAGLGGERTDKDLNGLPYTIPGGLSKLYRESLLGSLLQQLHPDKHFAPRRSSDEKVRHVIRQSRRTSLIQQENITDRKSTVTEDTEVDAQSEMIANARQESKRQAQVLSPDEMALLEGDSDDDDKEGVGGRGQTKPVFNSSQNTIHDPVLFGQHAPLVPDSRLEVIDVHMRRRSVGEEMPSLARSSHIPTKEDYEYSTNAGGYLHHTQDVDDLLAVIDRAKQEWADSFGGTVHVDMVKLQEDMQSARLGDKIVGTSVEKVAIAEENKIKIKIVLMGSNLIVHRFLAAYVALYTRPDFTMSDYNFEVFVVPQGRNHLGIFLARADKWYRRHVFDSFKGALGICPQYSAARQYSAVDVEDLHMQNCLPVKNLRQLLQNYVRQATQKFPFSVFECLCWAAEDEDVAQKKKTSSSPADDSANDMDVFNQKSTPDIIIPFVMQVQLGLLAQLEQFREKPSSMLKLEKQNDNRRVSLHHHPNEKTSLSMRECFADKDALFSGTDLSLQYLPSSITAPAGTSTCNANNNKAVHQNNAPSAATIQIESFCTLSITNFPCHNSSRDDFTKKKESTVTMPSEQLVMESQLNKGSCGELFQNRRKNARAMESFLEALHDKSTFEHPQHIGAIEINATNPKDSFHILVDGSLYGPFRRLIIRSCSTNENEEEKKKQTAKAGEESTYSGQTVDREAGLTLPIMTYMPIHQ